MAQKEEFAAIYHRHVRMVWNICYPYFMNEPETEDAVQETFYRLLRSGKQLRDEEHEKAWLIVTARNVCRDECKRQRRREVPITEADRLAVPEQDIDETLLALHDLPEKYRVTIYLYYYEGYSTAQIARMLHKPGATVRSDLHRGRSLLKQRLGGI